MSFAPDARVRFVLRRELAALRLGPGERLLWAGPAGRKRRDGLLAATDVRVVWLRRGLLVRRRQEWLLGDVERVEAQVHDLERATVLLWAARGATFGMERRDAKAFAEAVASTRARDSFKPVRLTGDPRQASPPEETANAAVRARLARLASMREKGSMTEPEYRASRERVLKEAGLQGR